jgi:hypothetical protein
MTRNDNNTKGTKMNATSKYRFKKIANDEDVREVFKDGVAIGRIYHSWTRLGGWGWNHKIIGQTYRSMRDAATAMEREAARAN